MTIFAILIVFVAVLSAFSLVYAVVKSDSYYERINSWIAFINLPVALMCLYVYYIISSQALRQFILIDRLVEFENMLFMVLVLAFGLMTANVFLTAVIRYKGKKAEMARGKK